MAVTNLVPCAPGPHLLFIALRDRGPPALLGLDAPDQGVGQGPNEPLGPLVERYPFLSSEFTWISFLPSEQTKF